MPINQPEIKTDLDLKQLPQFKFTTDLPSKSLYIAAENPTEDEISLGRIYEVKKDDARASDGKRRVRLTASSDATDLVGDVMSKNALVQMKNAAAGTTIFLNHSTDVPEDLFGSVEKAELVTRAFKMVDGGKEKILNLTCLDYDVIVEETNPRAVKTWEAIDAGNTKLGASITIAIVDKSALDGGRRLIDDVIYLETSIVGIPCNQTAWVQYVKNKSWVQMAKKSLRSISKDAPGPIEITTKPINLDELIEKSTENSGDEKMKLVNASTAAEAVVAFKDMFSDAVEEHFENPWLYLDLLSWAMMDLLWCNDLIPKEEKMTAASDMLDAFKIKMLEIFDTYFTEEDAEKSATLRKEFISGAAAYMEVALKAGARHSKETKKSVQQIHDITVELEAKCMSEEKAAPATEIKAVEEDKSTIADKTIIDASKIDIIVKVLDMPEVQAAIKEVEEKVTAAQSELEEEKAKNIKLEEQVKFLEVEKQNLTIDVAQWKAGATTATELLESYMDNPAPRPGASIN